MKKALVTGASRGIGRAVARRLCRDGFYVIINYARSDSDANSLLNELNNSYSIKCAELYKSDISDRSQVEAMFCASGGIDLLVNSAGIAQQKLFTDLTEQDWERMFAVDVTGVFHCCQLALPYMIHQKQGKIINISSMWGQVGASCEVHYSAAKAAVIGLTKALAKEVGPSNIQVNCIAPGVIDTQMNAALSEETIRELKEETPLCRIGTPEDIAAAVSFLASPDADFITGQILGINGGMII
ncbi:MAG TPA: 3-oxoacyl-ACP reductase FabG [Caproicibacter sp.]|nr:3-oxoacyl-ACP reductase FabG [Caproicibacter sp.]